jgi:predicted nuclease of predicted toxin-antitoxin system
MKFIVDAQLPRRLARFLQDSGFDTIHTLDLPQQNATPDSSINAISITEERVVITKDADRKARRKPLPLGMGSSLPRLQC